MSHLIFSLAGNTEREDRRCYYQYISLSLELGLIITLTQQTVMKIFPGFGIKIITGKISFIHSVKVFRNYFDTGLVAEKIYEDEDIFEDIPVIIILTRSPQRQEQREVRGTH